MSRSVIDFTMNTVVHAALQREVARLRRAIAAIDRHDPVARAGLLRRYQFFAEVAHNHYQGEDTYLYPRVRDQAQPDELVVLDAMAAEHAVLDDVVRRLGTALRQPDAGGETLEPLFVELSRVLAGHCTHEERAGVPILQRYISEEDVKEVLRHNKRVSDADLVLPWIADGASERHAALTWAFLPLVFRLPRRALMQHKYDRFTAECGI